MAPFSKLSGVDESLIDRGEIVGLLFKVADIDRTLIRIEHLLREDDDGEEETDS